MFSGCSIMAWGEINETDYALSSEKVMVAEFRQA
jgi:hypothetical protein